MKNYIAREMGGVQRGLKFNVRTISLIGDLSGSDPFQFKAASNDFNDVIEYVTTIVHAALLSNYASKKEEVTLTREEVKDWVYEFSPQDLALIMGMFHEFLNPTIERANGEVSEEGRTEAANVAAG